MPRKMSGNLTIGSKINRLTIVGSIVRGKKPEHSWVCKCDCGSEKIVYARNSELLRGVTKSCGCYSRDLSRDSIRIAKSNRAKKIKCAVCGVDMYAESDKQTVCSTECRFSMYESKSSDDVCWEWVGPINNNGYGVLSVGSKSVSNDCKVASAHRFAYEKYKGKIGDGLCVMHTCDNRKCTNPSHLITGTWAENNADRSRKGRSGKRVYSMDERARYSEMNRGECSSTAKLTESQAVEIKYDRTLGCVTASKKYGVSPSVIKSIRAGKSWKHI